MLVLEIMSSSLKTREGKQQNRNFHEEEFQRLLLITGTFFLHLSDFTTLKKAWSLVLSSGVHLSRVIKNNTSQGKGDMRRKREFKQPRTETRSHTGTTGACHFYRELKQENRKHVGDWR